MTDALIASFLFSARSRSFYNASRKLGITPQAVSKNIKKLEQEVDFALFEDRLGKPVLTEQGQEYMKFLIADDQQFIWTMDSAWRAQSPDDLTVRVGSYPEMFLSESFTRTLVELPGARSVCRCYDPELMRSELLQNRLEIALLDRHGSEDNRIVSRRFISFPMVLVAPRTLTHRLGAKSAADFMDQPVLVVEGTLSGLGEMDANRLFCSRFEHLALRPENIRVMPSLDDVESELLLERGISLCDVSNRLSVCPVFDIFPTGDIMELRLCCCRGRENDENVKALMHKLLDRAQQILDEIITAGERTEYINY